LYYLIKKFIFLFFIDKGIIQLKMKKLIVLTGAGISAESGIKTFRDAGGLWEGHDIMQVASPEGWKADPALVLDFYNQRRAQLNEVEPNDGHRILVDLENYFDVTIVTQNVDDLHERAGSSNVIHLHGELRKVRSVHDDQHILEWHNDLHLGDLGNEGHQLRPHIVWFGEAVPMMEKALMEVADADVVIVVGTSLQVYPAAGLLSYAPYHAQTFYVDPKPNISYEISQRKEIQIVPEIGSKGLETVWNILVGRN
jgi:NAD-dependent deacetylase